jgi:hypothetical protein
MSPRTKTESGLNVQPLPRLHAIVQHGIQHVRCDKTCTGFRGYRGLPRNAGRLWDACDALCVSLTAAPRFLRNGSWPPKAKDGAAPTR